MTLGSLFNNDNISSETFADATTTTFTPTTTGTYYFGFHGYSDANMCNLYVDNISIEELKSPTDLTANVSGSSVTLNWVAPVRGSNSEKENMPSSIRNIQKNEVPVILSERDSRKSQPNHKIDLSVILNNGTRAVTGYKVYRGETLLTETALANDVLTYTDTNVPDGTYTYKVVAVYGTDESAPATAQATVTSVTTQTIALTTGWNIISFNVIPANTDILQVFTPLIDANKLVLVLDEGTGRLDYDADFEEWVNSINPISATEGYRVKVTENCQLQVQGTPVPSNLSIPLTNGWNIISNPYSTQAALTIFNSLILSNNLVLALDEGIGRMDYDADFEEWVDTINNFVPGKGYRVKVNGNCNLVYPNPAKSNSNSIIFKQNKDFNK